MHWIFPLNYCRIHCFGRWNWILFNDQQNWNDTQFQFWWNASKFRSFKWWWILWNGLLSLAWRSLQRWLKSLFLRQILWQQFGSLRNVSIHCSIFFTFYPTSCYGQRWVNWKCGLHEPWIPSEIQPNTLSLNYQLLKISKSSSFQFIKYCNVTVFILFQIE